MIKTTPHSTVQTQPHLTDTQLLQLCQSYGAHAKLWKQKFVGLLPEVNKRKLYEQKSFGSIFEFAAKLGGVSREQVLLVLRLNKKFEETPRIHEALVSGTIPVHQLARVASVATPENQDFWVSQARLLSKPALETLIHDTRAVPRHASNLNKTDKIPQSDELSLSMQTRQRLLALQNKGLNIDQMVNDLLDQRERQIQEEKEKIGKELKHFKASRYIPMKVKHLLTQEFGTKCAHETCVNKASLVHHTRRFAIDPSHNPLYLVPLCKSHHEISHSVDVRVVEFRRGVRQQA